MAQFEWPNYAPFLDNFRPGIHIGDGGSWTDVGVFPIAAGTVKENAAKDFDYYPYDRIAFATRVGEDWTNRWGSYLFHQNEIRAVNLAGTDWPVVHTLVNMQDVLDFGVHTGLYMTWGHDGLAYLCGLYPGAGANMVGAVRFCLKTGVWDSWTEDVGGKFTRCASALAHDGRLRLATQGFEYSVDPANRKIHRRAGPAGSSDQRDALFVLSGRRFWAGKIAGRMKVFEDVGAFIEVADLLAFPMGIGGTWALLQDYSHAAFTFYTGLRVLDVFDRYYATFVLEAASSVPLSALGITDRTEAMGFLGPPVPIPLTSARVTGSHESDVVFLSMAHPTVKIQGGSVVTAAVHPLDRGQGTFRVEPLLAGPFTGLTAGSPSGIHYNSARYGMQDGLLQRGEKIEPYEVVAEPGFPRRLRIYYAGHTQQALGLQMSVRIYYRDTSVPGLTNAEGSPHPLKAATIASTPALLNGYDAPFGFNNVALKRIDNVPLTQVGEGHYVVWDLEADFGPTFNGPTPPFLLFMTFAGNMPPL